MRKPTILSRVSCLLFSICPLMGPWVCSGSAETLPASDRERDAVQDLIDSLSALRSDGSPSASILEWIENEEKRLQQEVIQEENRTRLLRERLKDLEQRRSELRSLLGSRTVSAAEAPAATGQSELWSLEPLVQPAVPVNSSKWVRTPIDAFILAKLMEKGLSPSPEADKRTLIRRLCYNLHGLPPTPEEIRDFVEDENPDAYERLVDRLLASPRYGERWGRRWLDVVHYADTHGYDKDKRRPNAWPYRDYVIDSLNKDKPYARFAQEQIAGDILFPENPVGGVATGFISAGPWDFVGHVELREGTKDKNITRNLDRDDMLTNTMSTFLSLTVHCARCHDHKFDPISQADYYSLQSVFAGVERADRPFDRDPVVHRERLALQAQEGSLKSRLALFKGRLVGATNEELVRLDGEISDLKLQLETLSKGEKSPTNGYHSGIESASKVEKWVTLDLGQARKIDRVVLVPARPVDFPDTAGFGFPARFQVDLSDTPDFSQPECLFASADEETQNPGEVPFAVEAQGKSGRYVRVTAEELWERTDDFVFALAEMQVLAASENVALGATVTALDSIQAGLWNTRALVDGYDSRRSLSSPSDPNRLEALEKDLAELAMGREEAARSTLPAVDRRDLEETERLLAEIERKLDDLPDPDWVYAAAPDFKPEGSFSPPKGPRTVQVLARGEVTRPGQEVLPRGLACVPGVQARFELEDSANEGARRAALAQWITDDKNALFWRSIVNRVWHYHFGAGIVDTPNDFGHMGGTPTHPELLDWLAVHFREKGGSLKALHKLILLSSVYRQSSLSRPAEAQIDADNRYLWRMNRRRLEAEEIRDAVLAISGEMNWEMGGPGFDLFGFIDDHSPHYLYQEHDVDDPKSLRRTVYRFIVRSVPDPLMECLDCADPSIQVPVRNTTLNALQALSLLNNPFMTRRAERLAARVIEDHASLQERIDRAWQLGLGRPPDGEESQVLSDYAEEHGLAPTCRLLFNTNEFVFVD